MGLLDGCCFCGTISHFQAIHQYTVHLFNIGGSRWFEILRNVKNNRENFVG